MNRIIATSIAGTFLLILGCTSGGGGDLAGKVTYAGKDVTGGTLVFAPMPSNDKQNTPGVPVSVQIQKDGKYSAPGVVVGKSTLTYVPPPDQYPEGYTPKPSEPPPSSPFKGLVPKEKQIEIKGGSSTFDIELVAPGKK